MNKQELSKISKLLEFIIRKEVTKATKPLLSEINKMKQIVEDQKIMMGQMILENMNNNHIPDSHMNGNDDVDVVESKLDNMYGMKKTQSLNNTSPLFDILSSTQPLEEHEEVSSILDVASKPSQSNPGMDLMSKVLNPDKLKRTLKVMENASSNNGAR